jgi:hypothetical protein
LEHYPQAVKFIVGKANEIPKNAEIFPLLVVLETFSFVLSFLASNHHHTAVSLYRTKTYAVLSSSMLG